MSKFEDGSYGSLTGIALIGKVLAGRCGMKYTRAAVGSGAIPEDKTPKTMTDVAGYVMDAKIAAVTNPVDGECQVTVQIKSDNVESGFYATGIVLFAEDPDLGEVPYTYLSLENEPEWIRPKSSIVGKLATFDLIAAVGEVDAVTAIIDPEAIATIGEVEQLIADHDADPNAHGGLIGGDKGSAQIIDITIPKASWTEESDESYTIDVPVPEAQEDLYPVITLHKPSLDTAWNAGLCPTVQALSGALRFWAKKQPTSDMNATVALLFSAESVPSGSSFPVASGSTLGGVKVRSGSGLTIDREGNLSIDKASKSDVEGLFTE